MEPIKSRHPLLFTAADRAGSPVSVFSHFLNPDSQIHGVSLGDAVGLKRVGIHLLRVPPGKESFAYHSHHAEEEFMYVLAGRGVAEIGGQSFEVGPGDFMGFPTPSVGHHLRNPFGEDLVYLSGGERAPAEIADFPRAGKRMVRVGMNISIYPLDAGEPFPGLPPLSSQP